MKISNENLKVGDVFIDKAKYKVKLLSTHACALRVEILEILKGVSTHFEVGDKYYIITSRMVRLLCRDGKKVL